MQLRGCNIASPILKPLPTLSLTSCQFLQVADLILCDWLSAYVLNFPQQLEVVEAKVLRLMETLEERWKVIRSCDETRAVLGSQAKYCYLPFHVLSRAKWRSMVRWQPERRFQTITTH